MKQIIFKFEEEEFPENNFLQNIIFANVMIFLLKNNLYSDDEIDVKITGQLIIELKQELNSLLNHLIQELYSDPDEKQIAKNSSRFEKVKINEKVYKLNYRMSLGDRIIFSVHSLLQFIERAETKGFGVQLRIV